ncbi:MAG: aminotransferase class III-fold pyridoxal phosphate-dependent enzyme [Arcanobacterium sp.]|nr:aminotransferase class III-fold pyridoxal phosphate-dependent enzyme [Arcanobacterium sp.]
MGWQENYDHSLLPVYEPPRLMLVRGKGAYVWDEAGRKYLDLIAGTGVTTLGHHHPAHIKVVHDFEDGIYYVTNYFASLPKIQLARKFQEILASEGYVGSQARSFFSTSADEAMEGALNIALHLKPGGRMIALKNSFHGRTHGAAAISEVLSELEATHTPSFAVTFIDPEVDALNAAMSDDVAAIILEPYQVAGALRRVQPEVLQRARDLCDRFDALLIIDESNTGLGRTGRWFVHAKHTKADVITLSRGVGSGHPIGATIVLNRKSRQISPGIGTSPLGGSALACALAMATITEVESLADDARLNGHWLSEELRALGYDVSGQGLLRDIHVNDAKVCVSQLEALGVLALASSPKAVRITPSLIVTQEDLKVFIAAMSELAELQAPHYQEK